MPRAWVVSFLVVAALTGLYLWSTAEDGATAPWTGNGSGARSQEQLLDVQSVELYCTVEPELDRVRVEAIRAGKPETIGDAVYAVLQTHGVDQARWNRIRRNVEDIVDAIRLEAKLPERRADLDRQIEMKQETLRGAKGDLKKRLEQEIAVLQAERDAVYTIHDADRELVRRYWKALDALVPRRGPGN